MGSWKEYKFSVLKNYPHSRHYEIIRKGKRWLDSFLENIGLKGEAE